MNNIDVEKAADFIEEVKKDSSKAVKIKKVEGEWVFGNGKPQFRAELQHGDHKTLVEADGPAFTGGHALKPDPVQYCLFGLASCFAQTFANIATEQGVPLNKLKVAAENKVNLSKPLGLGEEPIVESAKLTVEVECGADKNKIKEIEQAALGRCPGIYCLTHPIKLSVELHASQSVDEAQGEAQ